jgi:hypothetical protein
MPTGKEGHTSPDSTGARGSRRRGSRRQGLAAGLPLDLGRCPPSRRARGRRPDCRARGSLGSAAFCFVFATPAVRARGSLRSAAFAFARATPAVRAPGNLAGHPVWRTAFKACESCDQTSSISLRQRHALLRSAKRDHALWSAIAGGWRSVATRTVADFARCGIRVENPLETPADRLANPLLPPPPRTVVCTPREIGGGRAPRQPGQVRKEAAATGHRSGRLSVSHFSPAPHSAVR